MSSSLTRRDLLKVGGGAVAAGSMLSGCSFFETEPATKAGTGAGSRSAKEAPMLTKLVEADKLPPLSERLPKNPMTVTPQDVPGLYGGTLQRGQIDANANGMQYMGWASLAEWSSETPPKPMAALAEKWEIEKDGRIFVFHLRDGIRWSDGEPFTTEDIMYVYEHVFSNTKLSPTFPSWLSPGGEPAKFVQVDQLTFRMEFAQPHGLLLENLCFCGSVTDGEQNPMFQPKHYMARFHEDLVDEDKLQSMMKKAKQDAWADFYRLKHDMWKNPDLPVLGPWRISEPVDSGNTGTAERNPYYWKTDPDGRQLPYIDRAAFTVLNQEALGLRAANGEIDLAAYDIGYQGVPVLAKNQREKGYKLLRWPADGQFNAVYLNMSHPDPVLRGLFQNIDFRAGVAMAINRQEINDALLAGQGSIQHPCAQPEDPYFVDGMGMRFTGFDLDEANARMDAAGLTERGEDGMRLRPDGKRMLIVIQTFDVGVGIPMMKVLEFVKRYWAKVGIDVALKTISSQLWYEDIPKGKYDAVGYPPAGYLWEIDPLWYVPTANSTYWAPRYGEWFANPKSPTAMKPDPDGDIRKTQLLFEQMVKTVDKQDRLKLGQQILRLHDKNVWIIGTVRPPFSPVVASADMGNMRADAVASYRTEYEGAADLSQLYFKNPDQH